MRSVIVLLLLIGVVSADEIRIDHREGTTGNFSPVRLTTLPNYVLTFDANGNPMIGAQSGGSGGVSDGNKGDISVTGSGANWVINPAAVTLEKMANLAQAKLIGRWTASTGVPEAITIGPNFLTTAGTLSLAVAPQPLDADLTDLGGLTAAQGDILIGNGTGDWVKLAKGTANQVLRMNAGATLPEWAAAGGGADLAANNTWTGTNTFANVTAAAASVWNLTAATLTLPPISGALEVTTEAYDATGWNADNSVPTKDAVRDKIESLVLGGGGIAAGDSPTWTGAHTFTRAGAASAPTMSLTGAPFTGGTATTTKPLVLLEPTGTTSTGWGTSGTMLGVNAPSGFAGNLIDAQVAGASKFKVASTGATQFPAGSITAPSVALTNQYTGWYEASDGLFSAHTAVAGIGIFSYLVRINNTSLFQWSSGATNLAGGDVSLGRLGAANLRLGATPSATPIAQTLTLGEASRPGTDSNTAGANGTIQSGLGTGTGTASSLIFQTPTVAASGSTTQTYTTRLTLDASGATIPAIDLGTTLATDDTSRGTVRTGFNNSGGVTQWDAVYLNASSQWVLADANGTGTYPCRGLVTATATTGLASTVITRGTVRNDAWTWTPGGNVYLSVTAGGLTQTVPATTGDKIQIVGYALNADTLALEPSSDFGTSP